MAAASLVVWLTGCSQPQFACNESSQCASAGLQGTCEPTGFCSFPDDGCPSGARYAEHSGSNVSGTCVPTVGTTGTQTSTLGGSETSGGETTTGNDESSQTSSELGTTTENNTTGGCVPDCIGRECGPDGCGASCSPGCNSEKECGADGLCIACAPTWASVLGSGLQTAHFFDRGSLLVTGELGSSALLAKVSMCTGETLDSLTLATDSATLVATAATATGATWTIAGNLDSELLGTEVGFYGELDFDTLSSDDLFLLPPELEELRTVVDAGNGTRWFGGAGFPDGVTPLPRFVYQDAEVPESSCSLSLTGDLERGAVRSALVHDARIYLGGTHDGSAFFARFDPAQCSLDSCSCEPDLFVPLYPDVASGIWEMKLAGDTLYAVGYRNDDAGVGLEGFLIEIDLTLGSILDEWRWNPTANNDVIRNLWIQGETIYVVALTDGGGTKQSSSGALVALSPNLAAGPAWTRALPQLTNATAVVATDEAVFIAGRNSEFEQGWVMRCTQDGLCPD